MFGCQVHVAKLTFDIGFVDYSQNDDDDDISTMVITVIAISVAGACIIVIVIVFIFCVMLMKRQLEKAKKETGPTLANNTQIVV